MWLVELADLGDPPLVPNVVAAALGVREQPGLSLSTTLADWLRPRDLLLLLDNCEHLVGAVAALAELFLRDCPRLRILATSREPLVIEGEVTWRVPSLTAPVGEHLRADGPAATAALAESEAARLFLERAETAAPSFVVSERTAPAIARICARLDGIPLAIELAAAQVRVLSVEQIAARLDDRLGLLTGGSRTALPRQQTLRGAVEWSYELLAEPERALLRRLSVFAGGCTLDAVESVCAFDSDAGRAPRVPEGASSRARSAPDDVGGDLLGTLTGLIDKSLVQTEDDGDGETRYRLLEMVREFGRERLEAVGETATARARHRDYYRALADLAEPELWEPDALLWLDRLEREHDNLRAALTQCAGDIADAHARRGVGAAHGDLERATSPLLGMAGALWRFWFLHGRWSEGRRWLDHALAATVSDGPPSSRSLRARALSGAAELTRPQGDVHSAVRFMTEAVALWRDLEDRAQLAWSLARLAHYLTFLGEYDRADPLSEEALRLARPVGGRSLRLALIAVTDLASCRSDYAKALAAAEENLALNRHSVDAHALAPMLAYAGIAARELGEYAHAAARLEESVAVFRPFGGNHGTTVALRDLGLVAVYRGDDARAAALLGESLTLSRQLAARWNIYECVYELACLAIGWGLAATAARLYGAAEALRSSIGTALRPAQRDRYERRMAAARARLGDTGFATALREGHAMPLEAAMELALTVADRPRGRSGAADRSVRAGLLSRREQEVAARTARGLTNRQIAKELGLSERTVDAHIRNILGKLDFSSRAQIAAWSAEHGLAASQRG